MHLHMLLSGSHLTSCEYGPKVGLVIIHNLQRMKLSLRGLSIVSHRIMTIVFATSISQHSLFIDHHVETG